MQMATESVKEAYPDPNENTSKRAWERALWQWRAELRNDAAKVTAGEGDVSPGPGE